MKLKKPRWQRFQRDTLSTSLGHSSGYAYALIVPGENEVEIELALVSKEAQGKWIVASIGYVDWSGGASMDGKKHKTAWEAKLAAQGLLKRILRELATL